MFLCKSWFFIIFWCLCASFWWHPTVYNPKTNWIRIPCIRITRTPCFYLHTHRSRLLEQYSQPAVPIWEADHPFKLKFVVSLTIPLCHWSRLFVTVLKLHHDYSVSIFPTRDSTNHSQTHRVIMLTTRTIVLLVYMKHLSVNNFYLASERNWKELSDSGTNHRQIDFDICI